MFPVDQVVAELTGQALKASWQRFSLRRGSSAPVSAIRATTNTKRVEAILREK